MDIKTLVQEKQKVNLHCIISAVLNLLVATFQIVSMLLSSVKYCYFSWGLLSAYTEDSGIQDLTGYSSSYNHIGSTMCGSYKPIIQAACSDFCANVELFHKAGIVMMVFQLLTVFLNLAYVCLHLLAYKNRVPRSDLLYYGIWLPPFVFTVGVCLYISIGNIYGVNDTWKSEQDLKTGPGLTLAISVMILNFLPAIHSYIFTSARITN